MTLAIIILTRNEEIHIERCLSNIMPYSDQITVVDSYSTDDTERIVKRFGVKFIQNQFVNHAQQFNFALTQISKDAEWILRIDADEILSPELGESIRKVVTKNSTYDAFSIKRRMTFGGKKIRYGGLFPVEVVRLFRNGYGLCEHRWMDEHIITRGSVGLLNGELIDDSLKNLTSWIAKHNWYSNREAFEILRSNGKIYSADLRLNRSVYIKRLIKERVYSRLPIIPKVSLYFFYRYIIRLGFLDGAEGFAFHFLQGFWYRFLVESKVQEVKKYMQESGINLSDAVEKVLEIKSVDQKIL